MSGTRESKLGAKNPQWKGDNVGYDALHGWVRLRLPKPDNCQRCGVTIPYDLANISGEYTRDLTDWWWLCRRCHMESDDRLEKLRERNKAGDIKVGIVCGFCGETFKVQPCRIRRGNVRYCGVACQGKAFTASITHCPSGHAYDKDNTYITSVGGRKCRKCNSVRASILRRGI